MLRSSLSLLVLSVLLLIAANQSLATTTTAPTADTEFAELSQRWLDGTMRLNPVAATQTGDHRFDSELDDLSTQGRAKNTKFLRDMLTALEKINRMQLSPANQVDAAVLDNQLRYDIWNDETLQSWAWDPMIYNAIAGNAIYTLMARDFAPLPERLRAVTARMKKLPEFYLQMRSNLDLARVPKIHAETVAKQNKGVLSLIDELVVPHAAELPKTERKQLEAALANLRKAIELQQTWLDNTLVPNANGDFRLGQKLYDAKLAFALNSPLSRQDIRQRAEAELSRVRSEMYGIAKRVLKGKKDAPAAPKTPNTSEQQAVIQAALELAYADRPAREQVVATAKSTLVSATDFVRKKDLITLPDSPVQVILMPEFQRGVSVAYCDSPGPLDKGLATFYAVSPIPDDWSDAQVTSYLREYNTRSINELSVHEAMPGHYVQLWHSNKYPSTLRAVLSSGAFVEGWAMYTEKMMAEEGYFNKDPLSHLIQLKWYLRAIANAMLDQAIHVDGMTREQAMTLMTVRTFQEEREAAGKWVRAQLTSAQLPTYFVGVQEHLDLRNAIKQQQGNKFNLKHYHDQVLSYGSPPVRFVRALMLDEPIR